jgi:hypothetical protein
MVLAHPADPKERHEHCLMELSAALSYKTMKWIANHDSTEEEGASLEAIIQALQEHKKGVHKSNGNSYQAIHHEASQNGQPPQCLHQQEVERG